MELTLIGISKLVSNLKLLDARDLSRFHDLVRSPFFNKHQLTIQLADYLFDQADRWDEISKEELFDHLFPDEPYAEFKVNNLMSYLMELYIRFMEELGFEKSQDRAVIGLEVAQEKGLTKLFQSNLRKVRKALDTAEVIDQNHYQQSFQLLLLEHRHQLTKEKRYTTEFIKQVLPNFDVWYLKQKLELGCDMLSLASVSNEQTELPLLEHLLAYINEHKEQFVQFPVVMIFYKCLMTILYPEKEDFYFDLLAYFNHHESTFSRKDRENVYRYLLNYTTKKTNANLEYFAKETFNLYKRLLNYDYLLHEGHLPQITYSNITTLACQFGLYSWGEDFVHSYAAHLPDESRDNAYRFNLANIYFHQNRFEEALDLIQEVVYTNYFYKQKTKFLQVKIYYEMGEESLLFSALDSFRIFALRAKIPTLQRKGALNFVKLTKLLAKTVALKGVVRKETFRKKVEHLHDKLWSQKSPVLHKDWLVSKIEEL